MVGRLWSVFLSGLLASVDSWRPRLTIEAVGPDFRAVVARSELSLPFEIAIDHWYFVVPISCRADADRLLVTVMEPNTGAHAGAVLQLPQER